MFCMRTSNWTGIVRRQMTFSTFDTADERRHKNSWLSCVPQKMFGRHLNDNNVEQRAKMQTRQVHRVRASDTKSTSGNELILRSLGRWPLLAGEISLLDIWWVSFRVRWAPELKFETSESFFLFSHINFNFFTFQLFFPLIYFLAFLLRVHSRVVCIFGRKKKESVESRDAFWTCFRVYVGQWSVVVKISK